jgi:BRCA1-associated protein
VHRLLQNKGDGKLVEMNDPNNTTSQERTQNPGLSDAQTLEVVHRKLEGFASQYYTLLKSNLEQQRIFYEGRLEELRREYGTNSNTALNASGKPKQTGTQDLISALRQERKQVAQRVVSLKRRHQKVTDDVGFLKSMNESLESNKAPLAQKVIEAQRQRVEARDMIQQSLPALEEKLTMLMTQLEGSVTENQECAPTDCKPASRK